MRLAGSITILILFTVLSIPSPAGAQQRYTPDGLYDLDHVRLDNGFRVLLKQRRNTRNTAFRLVVNVGTRHFGCDRRATPHLLDHLLFSGTDRHSAAELEHLITDLGGTWNAAAGTERTVYQLDMFDQYALEGLDLLHEIVSGTILTKQKLDHAKSIVYREEGGRPGLVGRFLYGFGIGKNAWNKADAWLLPGEGAFCAGLTDLDAISLADVEKTYRSTYVPSNMTLIAVGNFGRKQLLERIKATFGSMAAAPRPDLKITTPPEPPTGPASVSSTLSPFFGSSGSFSVAFRTKGRLDADAPALIVLSAYLNEKFYEQVRVKAGLSYAPDAVMFFQPDYGILSATADANARDLGRVRELMCGIVETIQREKVTPEDVERTKRKILLQWAQGYETNAGLASLYADLLYRADFGPDAAGGQVRFPDYEQEIESVTPADLDRIIGRALRPEKRIGIRSDPTMSYAMFFSGIAAVLLAILFVFICRLRESARRKRGMLPMYLRK